MLSSREASSCSFFEAVERNNTNELIDLVLLTHCDPKYIRNEQQQTLLHVACQLNHSGVIDMIRVLVEIYQCNPLLTDTKSLTAYHYACLSGNLEVLSYLFRASDHHFVTDYYPPESIIDAQTYYGNLITLASQSGSIEILRFLFHHRVHNHSLKHSLYKDRLIVACKIANCDTLHILQRKHCWSQQHTTLYEVCCLDALKFFLDELTIERYSYRDPMLKHGWEKQVYASLLENAYKLNNFEIIRYLTISKGISPVQTTSYILYNDRHVTTSAHSITNDRHTIQVSPLHMAVRSGNTQIVRGLLSQGHHLYSNTDTLLHSACISGKREMVEILIDSLNIEYCINACDVNGDTPLHVACEWGHLETCLLLLEQKGCNIDATNCRGHTPLSLAVRHNRLKIFQTLLTEGANILVATNDTQETPLHFACCNISSQFAFSLLGNKSCTPEYLNARDKYGDTALFNACRIKNVETVRMLISNSGCDRSFVNNITKEMPAHVVSRANSLNVLRVLASEGLDGPVQCNQLNHLNKSLLHLACENDAEDIVDYLIDNKICEQNNFDCYGRKPLHIACMRGNTKIVKKLLTSEKFKVTDKDKEENTVLHYICNRSVVDPELIKSCLNNENRLMSMITEQNSSKYNPLHYACACDGTQILHCLLQLSKDHYKFFDTALCAPDGNEGNAPLHLAFMKRSSTIIKFMINSIELSKGISKAICVQNSDKKNVFHCAIDHRNCPLYDANGRKISNSFAVTMIDLLLQLQEDDVVSSLCQKNNKQHTPIQYLINEVPYGMEETIDVSILSHLLYSSLSPKSKQRIFSETTSDGNTLIHLAVKRGNFDIVKFLVNQKVCTFAICNERDESPLHLACHVSGTSERSFWLCEHGYDPYQLDKSGRSPLFNTMHQIISISS